MACYAQERVADCVGSVALIAMSRPDRHKQSLRRGFSFKVLVISSFCIALAFQGILCVALFERSKTIPTMERSAYDLLSERVVSNAGYLENDMMLRRASVEEAAEAVQNDIAQSLDRQKATASDIALGSDVAVTVVDDVADDLIELSQQAEVDGVYFILADGTEASADGETSHVGFCLRDSNPETAMEDRSDLLLAACPVSVSRRLGLSLDRSWSASLSLAPEGDAASDFYYEPLRAAQEYADAAVSDLGYWGRPTYLGWSGAHALTYSIPLRDASGTVVGVMGVEIAVDRVASSFPYGGLDAEGNGSYVLALSDGEGSVDEESGQRDYEALVTSGASQALYVDGDTLSTVMGGRGLLEVEPPDGSSAEGSASASVTSLRLYNATSPFSDEHWVLVGLVPDSVLFSASDNLARNLLIAFVLSLGVGIAVAVVAAWISSSRVRLLLREMRTAEPEGPIRFTPTGIIEIDEIADAVAALNSEVASAASRLSRILALSDRMIGAFERNESTGLLSFTEGFFEALGLDDVRMGRSEGVGGAQSQGTMAPEDLLKLVRTLSPRLESRTEGEDRYLIRVEGNPTRWARLIVREGDDGRWMTGLVEDVSEEIATRRRLERERDHDSLTGLMNRRAFDHAVGTRLTDAPPAFGAMLMMDLDNLKGVNDSYGHDWGDRYIKEAGSVLRRVFGNEGICAHVSGDEFLVFLDACENEDEALVLLASLMRELAAAQIEAPDGSTLIVRASMGVAFFPRDAHAYDQLREYADFAMYEAKSRGKGTLRRFDRTSYEDRLSLMDSKEDLDRLFEERLVDYHFQPIMEVRTGEVTGYEALMRLRVASLSTPDRMIGLARSQSKLHLVERMTFFEALAKFSRFSDRDGLLLFVNSVGAQRMSFSDEELLVERFGDMFGSLVVEFEERDCADEGIVDKERAFRHRGCRISIDGFGNSPGDHRALLESHADFAKIDMRVVRGVDVLSDHRDIVRPLIEHAHEQGILVIAEGVETEGELGTLVGLGVDYLQGYLIGRPSSHLIEPDEYVRRLVREASALSRG